MKVLWSWLLELCDLDQQPTVGGGRARAHRAAASRSRASPISAAGSPASSSPRSSASGRTRRRDKLTLVDVITERGGSGDPGRVRRAQRARRRAAACCGRSSARRCPAGITLARQAGEGRRVARHAVRGGRARHSATTTRGIIVLDADDAHRRSARRRSSALGLDDWLLEVNAPANRGDCSATSASRASCARCSAAGWCRRDADLVGVRPAARRRRAAAIAIDDPDGCPRYIARVIDGARRSRPSPRRIAAAAARRRRAPDLEPRRRHQLRDVRARPAAARVRLPTR